MPAFTRALRDHRLNGEADIASIAALIGDDARAAMLLALFGGGARSASQLAAEARVGAPAASKHLAKLVGGGLLEVEVRGRERLYRLASEEVAHLIETLANIAPVRSPRTLGESSRLEALRQARTCYDHLAGRLGVAIFGALVKRDALYEPNSAPSGWSQAARWTRSRRPRAPRRASLRRAWPPPGRLAGCGERVSGLD